MEHLAKLVDTLATKRQLNEDEFGLYRSLTVYLTLQYELAAKQLQKQLEKEEEDEDIRQSQRIAS